MFRPIGLGICHECLIKKFNENLSLTFARSSLTGQTFFELTHYKNGIEVSCDRLMNPVNIKDRNELQVELTKAATKCGAATVHHLKSDAAGK